MNFAAMLKAASRRAGIPDYAGTKRDNGLLYRDSILGELFKQIMIYMNMDPPKFHLYESCHRRISDGLIVDSKLYLPVNMFRARYVDAILLEVETNTKYQLCYGCRFVDGNGNQGHPSQKHHPCLSNSHDMNLANCWQRAHRQCRAEIVRDFCEDLTQRPDIYLNF